MNGSAVFILNAAHFPLFFKCSAQTDRRETDDACRMHPTSRSRREDSSARSALPPEAYSSMNASISCRETDSACRSYIPQSARGFICKISTSARGIFQHERPDRSPRNGRCMPNASHSQHVDSSARSALPPKAYSGMNTPTDRRERTVHNECPSTFRSRREDSAVKVGDSARDTLRRARFSDDGLI